MVRFEMQPSQCYVMLYEQFGKGLTLIRQRIANMLDKTYAYSYTATSVQTYRIVWRFH